MDIRDVMTELLEYEGYKISSAENGRAGLDFLIATQTLPNLILLDLMMPIMDGYAFRKAQLEDSRLSKVPLIILSASGDLETKRTQLSANDFIRKPVEIAHVLKSIAKWSA